MVRKRGFDNVYERDSNKMSRKSLSHTTPKGNRSKEGKNSLSDGLLNLYKREADILRNTSSAESEIEVLESTDNSVNKAQDNLENSEMIVKSRKTDRKNYKNELSYSPAYKLSAENKNPKDESKIDFDVAETPSKSVKKVKKTFSKALTAKESSITFKDCGGIDNLLEDTFKMFIHLKVPEFYRDLNVSPIRGLLLHGPHGCGKTHFARAIAGHFKMPLIEIVATDLVCGISGESESKIRETFDFAISIGPCILFIDEIDAITPKREAASGGMERRMVTQLAKCMDDLNDKDTAHNVMVIGATSMPDSIDPSLRGGSRFNRELAIGIPNEQAKIQILQVLCKDIKLSPNFDFAWIAHHTAGYVAADLKNLVSNAIDIGTCRLVGKISVKNSKQSDPTLSTLEIVESWFNTLGESKDEMSNLHFELCDFKEAFHVYVPYCKKEGFASVPNVTWTDVGALENVKEELQTAIMWPVKYNKFYEENNLSSTKGILLYGPKGCGKTLLAKALANECNINFLCVNGPELLNMYFGESEKSVRQCFERARNSAPCVIFFDEFDAFCPSRSASSSNAAAERVVNQLLTEMDGMQERKQVFVIAATNRKEKIDSAMLRPGRLEKQIYVGLPSPNGRIDILKSLTKNKTRPKIAEDLNLETIALDQRCDGFSGADLAFLVREATKKAVKEVICIFEAKSEVDLAEINFTVNWSHFDKVLDEKRIKPSINRNEREYFEKFEDIEKNEGTI